MAAATARHQTFDESDEEEDDFNPQPAADSDDEKRPQDDDKPTKSARTASAPRPASNPESEDESNPGRDKINGRASNGVADDTDGEIKVRPSGGYDDDDEGEEVNGDHDDEEDEEDDEDDDDAITSRPRKRRKKGGLNQFFEEEAEVDEDDDAEDDEDDVANDGFVADTHPDDLAALPEGTERDDRRHRELDRRREMEASMDAERQAEALRERYGRRQAANLADTVVVPKRLLLPGIDDPSIWGVKCKPGKEREVIMGIMKRITERQQSRNPMQILSAFERGAGSMAGYVYVEALRKADVESSLEGIMNVYPRSKLILVAVKEMPDLLRVSKTQEIQIGAYVRIKRGIYTGDLGVVEEVENDGLTLTIRLVPRLNYGIDEDDRNPMVGGDVKGDPLAKRKRMNAVRPNAVASRPPQRLFNETEAKKKHGRFLTAGGGALTSKTWNYKNETYEEGFLIKDFRVAHLVTSDVNPRLDEVTKLTKGAADGTQRLDLESLAQSLKHNTAEGSYQSGDNVEVYEGEQKGISGRTVSVAGNIVSIRVEGGDLAGQIVDVPMKGLRKRFRDGDHVQVIGGSRYRDEVGMIVRIKDDRVTVLTDMSMQEITVFSKDLREAGDATADGRLGSYDIHDLVQIDPATVGCIVKVDRETMRVLDQNGSIRQILPSQVSNRIDQRREAVATDRNGSEIRQGDVVKEVGGESRQGHIVHNHRAFVFLHNITQPENAGIFVARSTNVVTVAAKGGRATAADVKTTAALNQKSGMGAPMAPPQKTGRDKLIGKTVTVRSGPFKGILGIVKLTTDMTARVEMHSKSKLITVNKNDLVVKDPITGQTIDITRYNGPRTSGGPSRPTFGASTGSRVPVEVSGGRTPMAGDGGRTPAWGGVARTPAWAPNSAPPVDSSRTPSWKPNGGSQTSYSGNMTPYGGHMSAPSNPQSSFNAGGRTPAWSSSAKTPYGADHGSSSADYGSFDAFASGSRTPAQSGASGNRTPAWGAASAPTPGARPYDVPTPAPMSTRHDDFPTPYASAPTPAASAPTPHFLQDAPTPRGWDGGAPTPAPAARGANTEPLMHSRFDVATPAASAPTPAPYGGLGGGGGGGYGEADVATPAPGAGDGPRYVDSDED